MAAVEDNIREVEWRDLADPILSFVRMSTLYGELLLKCLQGGLFAAAFLVFDQHPSTPTQPCRRYNGGTHPHFSTA